MISQLIKPPKSKFKPAVDIAGYTEAKKSAIKFIHTLTAEQSKAIASMLQQGIDCCKGAAERYGVPHKEFQSELKTLLIGEQTNGNNEGKLHQPISKNRLLRK